MITALMICQVLVLAIVSGLLFLKFTEARKETAPAVETSWGDEPVTLESVQEVVRSNGYTLDDCDGDPTDVTFMISDTRFRINARNLPFLSFEVGYLMEREEMDVDLMQKAAAKVTGTMYVAKAVLLESAGALVFQGEMYCDSNAYLRNNFKRFVEMPFEAANYYGKVYNEMRENSRKAVEGIISSVFHKEKPDDQSGE